MTAKRSAWSLVFLFLLSALLVFAVWWRFCVTPNFSGRDAYYFIHDYLFY